MALYDLVSCGRACVDDSLLVPSSTGERGKTPISANYLSGGGQAATCAVVVAQLGGNSAFVGNLGKDSYGELILDELNSFGVDTNLVAFPDGYKTPRAVILVDQESGERRIYYEPTDERFQIPLSSEILENARSVILDPQVKPEELEKILQWKPKHCIVVYDAERMRPSLNQMKECADYFIASETILDIPIEGVVDRGLSLRALMNDVRGELIVTFGEHGSIWVKENTFIQVPALQVEAIDTTGAGDVYHAAFAYFQPRTGNVLETMKLATACASLSTCYRGTRTKMPFKTYLETFETKSIQAKELSFEELKNLL